MVPLMEEEMSFLAKLIVQKRAVLLFREAPATLPAHLLYMHTLHTHTHIHTAKHTSGFSVKIMEFGVQQVETNAHPDTSTLRERPHLSRTEFSLWHLQTDG